MPALWSPRRRAGSSSPARAAPRGTKTAPSRPIHRRRRSRPDPPCASRPVAYHDRSSRASPARLRHHSLRGVTGPPTPPTLATTATPPPIGPTRTVHQGDALPWLRAAGTLSGASVVTSLPDSSELPALGLDGWRRWFDEAAVLTM